MKNLRAGLRLLVLVVLLILALFGIGITGNFLNGNRDKYMDNEIKTEKKDKEEDEENQDKSKA